MSRKRVIDTEIYFDTELCSLLGAKGLHLYIRLWGLADDSGVYQPNYKDIALRMGALKFTDKEVSDMIYGLIQVGKIIPFTGSTGKPYHYLKNFLRHQPLRNPAVPKYPLPEWIHCEIKEYRSGKKYANYSIIHENLPVGYSETTGSLPVDYQYPTSSPKTETETETKLETETGNETETKQETETTVAVASEIPDWINQESWDGFVEMRKKIKKPLTDRAKKLTIRQLYDMKQSGQDPGEVLDQSTRNSWQGVFEVKTRGGEGYGKTGRSGQQGTGRFNPAGGIMPEPGKYAHLGKTVINN